MAMRLARAGFPFNVFDLRPEAMSEFVSFPRDEDLSALASCLPHPDRLRRSPVAARVRQ